MSLVAGQPSNSSVTAQLLHLNETRMLLAPHDQLRLQYIERLLTVYRRRAGDDNLTLLNSFQSEPLTGISRS